MNKFLLVSKLFLENLSSTVYGARSETHKNQKNEFWKTRKIFNIGEIGKILIFLVFYENFEEKPEKLIFFFQKSQNI